MLQITGAQVRTAGVLSSSEGLERAIFSGLFWFVSPAVLNSIAYPATPPGLSTPGTLAHGLLSPQQQDKAARQCIDEVLRPVMASLLSRALAA